MATEDKGWRGNFFEDFELGQRIVCPTPRRLTEGDVAAYLALTGDRTPGFCGADAVIHPLIVFHAVMGQTVRPISLNARANLGYAGMVFRRPVRVGATLTTTVEILGLKENSSRKTGIVWVRTEGRDDDGERVLDYVRWVMVHKRGEAETRWLAEPVVPELPKVVAPAELPTGHLALPTAEATGGRFFFEDYEEGERIHHVDGQTVNHSDHMSFTRLFQNSAKVHFDARLTGGDPLVYGGYPISLGYAQAFNGLENRVGLAAINGGTHANPVHAGDTLYSFTDVVAKDDLGDAPVGALRCRLLVVKNLDLAERPDFDPRPGGKHDPAVVLDLDLWERVVKQGAA